MWTQLFALLMAVLLAWFLIRNIRNNPETFSKQNFAKSFSTMGLLALILIAFIAFCIMLLKTS